jgi:DNA-directed RNA polymerase subunit RPC12/RpoP
MPQRHQSVTQSPAYVPPTICLRCGANVRLVWRSPLPADLKGEMRAFECKDCGKQTKIIVDD